MAALEDAAAPTSAPADASAAPADASGASSAPESRAPEDTAAASAPAEDTAAASAPEEASAAEPVEATLRTTLGFEGLSLEAVKALEPALVSTVADAAGVSEDRVTVVGYSTGEALGRRSSEGSSRRLQDGRVEVIVEVTVPAQRGGGGAVSWNRASRLEELQESPSALADALRSELARSSALAEAFAAAGGREDFKVSIAPLRLPADEQVVPADALEESTAAAWAAVAAWLLTRA